MELGNKRSRRGVFVLALISSLGQLTDSVAQDRFIRQPKKDVSQQQPANTDSAPASSSVLTLQPPNDISDNLVSATTSPLSSPQSATSRSDAARRSSPSQVSSPHRFGSSQPDTAGLHWRPRGAAPSSTAIQPNSTHTSERPGESFHLSGFRAPLRSDPVSLQLDSPSVSQRASRYEGTSSSSDSLRRDVTDIDRSVGPESSTSHVESAGRQFASAIAQTRDQVDYAKIASNISKELIDQHNTQRPTGEHVAASLELPPGWQAVRERLSEHMRRCEQMIARKANLSAIEEAQTAIHYLLQILDQHGNQFQCEPLWSEAQQLFREAEDFAVSQRTAGDPQFLARLIESHQSRVLKEVDVSHLSPLAAAQHYHRYTQNRLVLASAGHPWASELYYVLGRALQARADEGGDAADALRQRAVTYYRAAREIMPANSMATNQLGYLLLTMDRPEDAREALLASTQSGGTIASWQNLVEANRRLGDSAGQNWAMQNYAALNRRATAQPQIPPFVELTPQQFAMVSPRGSGPKPQDSPAFSMQPGVQPGQVHSAGHGYTANRFGNAPAVR